MDDGEGYRFGPFTLSLGRASLEADGTTIALRPKSFDVLRHLVENAGRIATKDEIVAAVWPDVVVTDDSLTQCVRDVRKALDDDGERFIKTVPRRGYMFVADVLPLTGLEASPSSGLRRWRLPVATGLVATLILLAVAAWTSGLFGHRLASYDARMTVAVLPFANLSENPEGEWLGDGIAEDIITAVSRFRDISVIARNSSFRYRENADVRQIGQELNADFLLMGTVRRGGDRLRVTAQLVESRTGTSRWTERYDRPIADVFAVQDEIADSIAALLSTHAREATVARIRAQRPETLEAYELTLRGRKAYRTFTRDGMIEARELAERAIALDPNYAAPWEVLAIALLQFYVQPYDEQHAETETLQAARRSAQRAVELDANFSTGRATLATILNWSKEHEAAVATARKAVELNPNDTVAQAVLGNVLSFAGHYRESLEAWERAALFDPFIPALNLALHARPYVMLGEYEAALRLAQSCAERAPRLQPCFLFVAIAANELGRKEEAQAAVDRILEISPTFSVERYMAFRPAATEAEAARFADYLRRAGLPE